MTEIRPPPFRQPPLRPRVIEDKKPSGMSVPTLIICVAAGILLAMFVLCAGMQVLSFVLPYVAGNK